MNSTYKVASYSGIALTWTIGFILVFLYFLARVIATVSTGGKPDAFDVVISFLLAVMIVYGWIRSVKCFRLADDRLMIERRGPGTVQVPFDKIKSVQFKPTLGAFFNARFFSIGGLFGWAGKAQVRNPTNPADIRATQAEVYGTNPKYSVVLELESGLILIVTPNDPQTLAEQLNELIPKRRSTSYTRPKRKAR